MKLNYDPIPFIRKKGTAYHELKLEIIFGEEPKEKRSLLEKTLLLQNQNGSWPWQWKQGNPGGVIETANALEILASAIIERISHVKAFLWSIQRPDGGWSENPELKAHLPEDWVFWRTDCSSPFFTGETLCALITSSDERDLPIKKAIGYLEASQNDDGGWPLNSDPQYSRSDPICTNSALRALVLAGIPRNSSILQRGLAGMHSNFESWKKPLYEFSEPWAASAILESFLMLDPENNHITDLVTYLIGIQRHDGGWGWKKDPSNPDQTLQCLKALQTAKEAFPP